MQNPHNFVKVYCLGHIPSTVHLHKLGDRIPLVSYRSPSAKGKTLRQLLTAFQDRSFFHQLTLKFIDKV